MKRTSHLAITLILLFIPQSSWASELSSDRIDLTHHFVGYIAITIFVIAYILVVFEEQLYLHKSKPVLLVAGIIWAMIAFVYQTHGIEDATGIALRHNFLEYAELFFFLLVAMSYINVMVERGVFEVLRFWLVDKGFSYRQLFWFTGALAFLISPIADNLTTALIMCTVVLSVGEQQAKFVSIACVNIVVAANAGGAFSPFGDITTLMVWQKGIIDFTAFFQLIIPSLVNFLIPAGIMHFYIPHGFPEAAEHESVEMADGGLFTVGLFLLTIITAVSFHSFLNLPPAFGMLTGLGYLKFFAYYLRVKHRHQEQSEENICEQNTQRSFNIFSHIAAAEWDTLFFFYGVIMAVGGLGFIGYLSLSSEFIYGELGATYANILVGIISALVDNIPVMFAVLTMNPDMSQSQWLLVTLTAGVGGSLLSAGSAAGVALMGQARGIYTFFSHLKWTPVIALGYFASIYVHLLLNG